MEAMSLDVSNRTPHVAPHVRKALPMSGCARLSRAASGARSWVIACLVVALGLGCSESDPMAEVRRLQASNRLAESLEPLRELLVTHPNDAEVSYRYGLALSRTGKPGMAVWSLRRAQEDPEWSRRASLELAHSALASFNWSNAIEGATRVLDEDPDDVEALRIRGEAYVGQMTDPERAIADFDRALEIDPDEIALRMGRARALIMAERIDEAGEEIAALTARSEEVLAENRPIQGPICALHVVFLKESGQPDEAEARLQECLADFPADGTLVEMAIDLHDARGEFELATDRVRKALETAPGSLRFRSQLAGRLRAHGRVAEAEAVLRKGLEIDSPGLAAEIWTALARHFADLGDARGVAEAYGEAVALAPEVSEIGWLSYADMLVEAGDLEKALEVSENLEKEHFRQLVQARAALARGDSETALGLFDEVLPLWPNNAGARYYAARAAEQQGAYDRALAEYQQAIRSDAAATDAGLRFAELKLALGDEGSAWTGAGHHVRAQPGDREGHLMLLRLAVRRGPKAVENQLKSIAQTPHWPAAVAAQLDRIARTQGEDEALERFRSIGLDLTRPWNADALRAYVGHLMAAGDAETARSVVDAALAAEPEVAAFHSIDGFQAELQAGAPEAGVEAYRRAVALDPNEPYALAGLGRAAAEAGDVASALDFYDRAAPGRPRDPTVLIQAARLAAERELPAERVEERWRIVHREFPWEREPLEQLARLAMARGDSLEAMKLGERAVRFGAGPETWRFLADIYGARGQAERAAEALKHAEALSAKPAG